MTITDAVRAKALKDLGPQPEQEGETSEIHEKERGNPEAAAHMSEPMTTTTAAEPPQAEAVLVDESVALEIRNRKEPTAAEVAITRAAEYAIEQPGIPGRDEFLQLCLMAKMLSSSELAPKALRGKPYDMLVILLTGRDLGVPLTAAVNLIYVIDGKPSIAPKLLNARLRQLGAGSIRPGRGNSIFVSQAYAVGPDGKALVDPVDGKPVDPISFTWEDAQRADLVCDDCKPDEHADHCRKWNGKTDFNQDHVRMRCKHNYQTYPRDMLWWRAAQRCSDVYFPEAALGLYNPDELGALTDQNGDAIDLDSLELPEGFDSKGSGSHSGSQSTDEPADPHAVAELQIAAMALDPDGRKDLRDRWNNAQVSGQKLPASPRDLTTGPQVRVATALIRGIQAQAKSRGWDQSAAGAAVLGDLAQGLAFWIGLGTGTAPVPEPVPPSGGDHPAPAQEPPEASAEDEAPEPEAQPETAPGPVWCWCGERIQGHTVSDHEPGDFLPHPPLCPRDVATAEDPGAGMPEGLPSAMADVLLSFVSFLDEDGVINCLLERGAIPHQEDDTVRRRQLITLLAREAAGAREES